MLSAKPWKPEAVLRLTLATFVSMSLATLSVAALVPAAARDTGAGRFLVLLAGTVGFHWAGLLLIALFLREHEIGWKHAFGFNEDTARSLRLAVLVVAVVLPVCWGLGQFSAWLMLQFEQKPVEQFTVQTLQLAVAPDQQIYAAIAAIALAPAVEEMLFRGILYPAIKQLGWPRLALWSTSLFFAVIHANWMTFLPLTVLAVVLTWLYERTGNLLAPIATHALFNAANFILLTFMKDIERWLSASK
ncbi:MAG: CPBP family intramembrane metalloprotease [Verrucomicrobia bacterium]|nr:CPBP family intramembrane metalloprotease [Verrucomicrobiota bacterium]